MKKLLLTTAILLAAFFSKAQLTPIMVCNAQGDTCMPFYDLTAAYTAANTGDYIYLPGGVYVFSPTIAKEVHIIGNGCHADSAVVGGVTLINGNISISGAGSGTTLEGMYLSGSIFVTSAINNLNVKHCNFHSVSGNISNSNFKWSIFRTGSQLENNFNNGTNNNITNCFLYSVYNLHSSTIDQCTGIYYCENLNFCTLKNSTFNNVGYSYYGYYGSNNIIKYNFYAGACGGQCISSIFYSNNQQGTIANTYVAGSITPTNFKLKTTSPAMTASESGGQVGAYGGAFPYKEGAVPSNPHIYYKNISSITDSNGNLPVNISVRAENY